MALTVAVTLAFVVTFVVAVTLAFVMAIVVTVAVAAVVASMSVAGLVAVVSTVSLVTIGDGGSHDVVLDRGCGRSNFRGGSYHARGRGLLAAAIA